MGEFVVGALIQARAWDGRKESMVVANSERALERYCVSYLAFKRKRIRKTLAYIVRVKLKEK